MFFFVSHPPSLLAVRIKPFLSVNSQTTQTAPFPSGGVVTHFRMGHDLLFPGGLKLVYNKLEYIVRITNKLIDKQHN
jgi:hypothetical protein